MPGGLQCSMHWFPPPVNYPSQYDPGCWTRRKATNKQTNQDNKQSFPVNKLCASCVSYVKQLRRCLTCLNLGPGASCWKVGSYLPMPGGLQCSVHWFPPPVNYPSQYDPGCWTRRKATNKQTNQDNKQSFPVNRLCASCVFWVSESKSKKKMTQKLCPANGIRK